MTNELKTLIHNLCLAAVDEYRLPALKEETSAALYAATEALEAYVAKQGPRAGFRFVPRKASPAMIEAYNNVPSGIGGSPPHGANVWEAMLDAVTIWPN
jgi:hypothetical protein